MESLHQLSRECLIRIPLYQSIKVHQVHYFTLCSWTNIKDSFESIYENTKYNYLIKVS